MKGPLLILSGVIVASLITYTGCNNNPKTGEHKSPATLEAEHSAHDRDEHGGDEGEESGTQLNLDQKYDEVRKGTHLLLSYDAESNSFTGTVENVSDEILSK